MAVIREKLIEKSPSSVKRFHCEMKADDTSKRQIKGFANTRFKDRVNDIVDPQAFAGAMDVFMTNPIMLLQHCQANPIGQVKDYKINQDGLYITGEIAHGTEDADETWSLISQGVLRALSIGFYPIEWDYDTESDASIIRELELVEISVVSIPANRESLFSVAKALRDGTDLVAIPDKSLIAVMEVKKHLAYLKNIYATLPKERKIEIDVIHLSLENMFNLDERARELKAADHLSKSILIDASLRGRPSDSE